MYRRCMEFPMPIYIPLATRLDRLPYGCAIKRRAAELGLPKEDGPRGADRAAAAPNAYLT
jgi:hypothetical protein